MGENIGSRELDLALFHLNTAIHEKLGDDYVNSSHTFDRMDTIEVIETMLKSVKRAYRGYVMGQLAEENENLDRRLNNAKREMNRLEKERETYKERVETLEKENRDLLWMQDVLQKQLDKRVKNSREDIDVDEVKYLHKKGMSVIAIAKRFNTNRQTIYNKLRKPSASNGLYM